MASFPEKLSYQHNITSHSAASPSIFNNRNLIEMFNAVQYTLLTNTDIIESIPYFIEIVDKFQNNLIRYRELSAGFTSNLISIYFQIIKMLKSSGLIKRSADSGNYSPANEKTLREMPENVLIFECKLLLEHLEEHIELFLQDNLFLNKLKEFSDNIDAFEKLTSINLFETNRNNQSGSINIMLKLLNNKIDSLVNHLKNIHPNFYYEYKKARKYYYDTPHTINN